MTVKRALRGFPYIGSRILVLAFLPAATKLGQGNVFTGVCDSVHRGGGVCLSAYRDTTPPREQTPPPGADTPTEQTTAYGQRAAGKHPTGMHSCSPYNTARLQPVVQKY